MCQIPNQPLSPSSAASEELAEEKKELLRSLQNKRLICVSVISIIHHTRLSYQGFWVKNGFQWYRLGAHMCKVSNYITAFYIYIVDM